ncbi:hypothetical protein Mlaev_02451 [Microbacterium laevaniformans]|uniref:ParA family protein n=1 Tax=Microbacterium laevaniformans TaxID=36807 RepID=A0A150HA95_9MICO|nr:hypothetical protein [Microbacterium laevaniformans]KXZ58748.1 hypothetical protein Mlaev_02451 [Microbacterium laevaniformans]
MAVIALASFSGAPGVTTTALAMTFAWHRPALLVEVDTAKTSSILPGYLRGQFGRDRGLTALAIAQQNNALTAAEVMEQRIELAPDRSVILGLSSIVAAQSTTALWSELGATLSTLDSAGMDVILDVGRVSVRDPRSSLLQIADSVQVLLRPTLPDIYTTAAQLTELRDLLAQAGHREYLELLLVDTPLETWPRADIVKLTNVDVSAEIVHDPRSAAVYYAGAEPSRKLTRNSYTRSITTAADLIRARVLKRQELIGARPTRQETLG